MIDIRIKPIANTNIDAIYIANFLEMRYINMNIIIKIYKTYILIFNLLC